mgnify:CR=1 FL=1
MGGGILAFLGFNSCTTEPDLTGVPEVSFSNDVQRILSSHCNFSGCHASTGGEFSLETYDAVMGYVKSGNAHGSELYKIITNKGIVVEERMPPSGYEQVSPQDVKLLYWWIEQGAKNN